MITIPIQRAACMNSFENQFIEKQQITHNILQLLGEIREFKGKQDLFKNQSPQTGCGSGVSVTQKCL